MTSVYIHTYSLSKFGKSSKSVRELSRITAKECLKKFEGKIDLLVISSFAPETFTGEYHLSAKIASDLGLKDTFSIRVETASSTGASGFHVASKILQGGKYKNALIIGTEVMTKLNREASNLLLGSVLSETERSFSMSMMQGAALICNRYLSDFKYKKEDLFCIAEKLHQNGLSNPIAHIRKSITKEDYFSAPLFSSPLGLYDISPISDGCCAMILSTEKKSNFLLKGLGCGISNFTPPATTSFSASKFAFNMAYRDANLTSSDVRLAELHDAFTIFEAIGAEDGGLFPEGKALGYIKDGYTHPKSHLPINASGGLKTRGHPIGASGLSQIAELCNQLQIHNLNIGLTHSIGGLGTNNFVTLVEQV